MLIDRARIFVKAGDGGKGSASFSREKYKPLGGPDGGDGGRGGDVILRVRPNLQSLLPYQYNQQFVAEPGQMGMGAQKHGKSAKTIYIDVPPGTVVHDDETGDVIIDLTESDQTYVIAKAGRGGLGNVHFKTSTRQAPRIAELGEPGEERWIRLELKLIADVGLVGLPNAGKSTLLAASTAARPKIADYPFTTLQPNLGVVAIGGRGGSTFVMADVPGLIEGAAAGAGLGHEFLRHVSRTKVLVHVLDAAGGLEGRDPLEDFHTINEELQLFDPHLSNKPMLVALNKMDLPEGRENAKKLKKAIEKRGNPVFEISAATREGIQPLLNAVSEALRQVAIDEEEERNKPQARKVYTLDTSNDRSWVVEKVGDNEYSVTGVAIERFTRMTNFELEDSVDRFQRVLEGSGISKELEKQGVEAGDVVKIADHELTWGEYFELEDEDD